MATCTPMMAESHSTCCGHATHALSPAAAIPGVTLAQLPGKSGLPIATRQRGQTGRQVKMEWAKNVKLRIFNLPGFVGLLHYRAKIPVHHESYKFAMIAYVRHQHTNYENLLARLNDEPLGDERGIIYLEIRHRLDGQIAKALDERYGDAWQEPTMHRAGEK